MANFTRVRELGMWIAGILWPSELEKFDSQLSKAVNGEGGTYSPTTPIVINGSSGLNIGANGRIDCDGVINIRSGGQLYNSAGSSVSFSSASLTGTTAVAGTLSIGSGGTLSIGAGGALSMSASSVATINGGCTIGSTGSGFTINATTCTSAANTTHNGTVTINGTLTVENVEVHSGVFYDGITANVNMYAYKKSIWVRATGSSLVVISGFDAALPVGAEFTVYNCGSVEFTFRANAAHNANVPAKSMRTYRKLDLNADINSYITIATPTGA
jgi:hypothetical protein